MAGVTSTPAGGDSPGTVGSGGRPARPASVTRVAKLLGLNPTHLSRRKAECSLNTPFKEDVGTEFAFVSVPVANPTAVSLRVEHPDGTKLILEFHNTNLSDLASFCAAVR